MGSISSKKHEMDILGFSIQLKESLPPTPFRFPPLHQLLPDNVQLSDSMCCYEAPWLLCMTNDFCGSLWLTKTALGNLDIWSWHVLRNCLSSLFAISDYRFEIPGPLVSPKLARGWSGAGVGVGMLRGIPWYWFSKMYRYYLRSQRFQNWIVQEILRFHAHPKLSKIIKKISKLFQTYLRFTGIYLNSKIIKNTDKPN